MTIVFNVPLNETLATVNPESADAVSLWHYYLSRWTAWNHVRTISALAATASLTIALCNPATTRRVSWLTRIVPISDEQGEIYTVRYEAVNAMFDHVACFIINANHSMM